MSETSTKTSVKKGFTAPVLKENSTGENKHGVSKKSKAVHGESRELSKQKEIKKTHNPNENKENCNISGKPKQKKEIKKTNNHDENNENCKISDKPKQKKKPETSLTDSQYDDIFSAVLSLQKSNSNSQHNTEETVHFFETQKQHTPSNEIQEGSEKQQKREMSQEMLPFATPAKQQKRADTKTPPSSHKALSELSPWGSHFNKQPSQGSSILKEMQESQNSLQMSMMSSDSSSSSDERAEEKDELSQKQPSRKLSQVSGLGGSQGDTVATDQRRRLEELQRQRNVGVWVFCCRQSCQKQRYLADVTDPQDVPDIWYCHMNPDVKYNNCQYKEQQLSAEEEEDMIFNQFTAGSLVWARVDGYPWWPAMVDDDPDLEQYYWLADDFFSVTYYHVVFFDETSVTRAWVNLKNIAPYSKNGSKYKQRMARGIDYTRRIMVAKEQADDAVGLSTTQRLKIYSFIARYKGPITTSASQVKKTMTKYKLKVKTHKNSTKQVNSRKERKDKDAVVKEMKKNKEDKRIRMKDSEETHCNSSISGNTKYGKRKKNNDDEECNKKPKKPRTMFEKKTDNIMNKKAKKEKINAKNIEQFVDLGLNSSNTEKKCNQGKKQKDSLKANRPDLFKENVLEKPVEESLSSVNNKLSEEIENASEREDNKAQNEEQRVIEKNVVVDTEKYINDSKEPSTIPNTETEEEPQEQESKFDSLVQDDTTNVEEKVFTSEKITESETPSGLEFNPNLSQKSKSSDRRNRPGPADKHADDVVCSLVQPSQESKHSQSTIADFFGDSEDAVVPDGDILSQLSSQPFEE